MTDTSESTPQGLYKVGNQITIRRGKHAGKTATVLDVNRADSVYAVRYADGGFGAVNHDNVKPKMEPTITKSALFALIEQHGPELDDVVQALNELPAWD